MAKAAHGHTLQRRQVHGGYHVALDQRRRDSISKKPIALGDHLAGYRRGADNALTKSSSLETTVLKS
jgi:hypothetical protein